ncbi:Type I restriction modification DNA specificity domain-containing protein [Acetoanaerobium noterae]|uniref:Type I restriction modification DNA specificity domain-containing protein n=1 Tax=Acetoanaerobium noterae TaxID=745369 RepID=A0A1T5DMQ8_9FIRM|nr:restriction endonuclease subunit S [Acetoanaerobium noterae]SKB72905.1 Type I restriction modification DNA specificity domain-containing protein [Acetoanaerobium noterae]
MKYSFVTNEFFDCDRLDPDYWIKQQYIRNLFKGKEVVRLKDIAVEVTDGTRTKREFIKTGGYRFIGPSNIIENYINIHNLKRISGQDLKEKDFVEKGDILLTSIGKSGRVVLVPEELDGCVYSSDLIKVKILDESIRVQVFNHLIGPMGQLQLDAIKMGVLNRISISDLKDLEIPKRNTTETTVNFNDSEKEREAKKLYNYLVSRFDEVVQYKSTEDVMQIRSYVSEKTLENERWDVEYYKFFMSKLYDLIYKTDNQVKWQRLKDMVEIKKANLPEIHPEQIVRYFFIKDIDSVTSIILKYREDKFGELSNRVRIQVEEGDILTSKAGSATGTENHTTTIVTKEFESMFTTDALLCIKPKLIDPFYLLFLLKQPVVLKQIEMKSTGTYIKLIQNKDFENIMIPRLTETIEYDISMGMKKFIALNKKYSL